MVADLSDANYPLLIAVKGFFSECETGISPEYINSDNETIWHLIARINSVPLAQSNCSLLSTKPNLLLKNRIEKTALESAMDMENFDIAFEFLNFMTIKLTWFIRELRQFVDLEYFT